MKKEYFATMESVKCVHRFFTSI